ncbi:MULTISPECIES: DUF1361 domain-containing protein [Virgibacillus]|uniref:DUF1361 domain-containing protein n=2 Tax=Virgibacillus TaxID=84406 RepID=A0ABQ2DWW6_9BACI|nr:MULTISPECIES: DUF1361 domain-containing protein [Virgibacillus]EQB36736.1 hypothetical protein M948_17025 [Virgibacillus sp. CM-4]MYL42563.1 DUF1361 domain-containing protein [Virgibacillus massiliensis]GGJ74105.1 hypothetical protein GCM10007111_39640 [Virgibacillus kapii]CDQ40444.1 putative membrane protein [Virgibacillus massiliensis]
MNERTKARISFFIYIGLLIVFDTSYSFMILNLFLAFAALELSFLLRLFHVQNKREIPMSVLFFIVFLLLSPNAIYVVTDLIHLNVFAFDFKEGLQLNEWWNFTILVSGVILAIYYYVNMIKQVYFYSNDITSAKWLFFVFILLSSIGVFIGRFLRFHSIHLFTEPVTLIVRFIEAIDFSAVLFISWMSILQFLICWLFLDGTGEAHDK